MKKCSTIKKVSIKLGIFALMYVAYILKKNLMVHEDTTYEHVHFNMFVFCKQMNKHVQQLKSSRISC